MNPRWRLNRLVALTNRIIDDSSLPDDVSGRVQWKPTVRVARYYTTIGLLDRPAEMRGRTAYYGERHLLQLLAIKALQLSGFSLKEIEQRLAGLSNRKLKETSGLSEDWSVKEMLPVPKEEKEEVKRKIRAIGVRLDRGKFWQRRQEVIKCDSVSEMLDMDKEEPASDILESAGLAIKLGPGVRLLIDGETMDGIDREDLRKALVPLLKLLKSNKGNSDHEE